MAKQSMPKTYRPLRRRMFGDYPIDDPGYWIWMAGVIAIGLFSLLLMFAVKE